MSAQIRAVDMTDLFWLIDTQTEDLAQYLFSDRAGPTTRYRLQNFMSVQRRCITSVIGATLMSQ